MLFSQSADADRVFLGDVLGWPSVPADGEGDPWRIFRLPPAEAGVHPGAGPGSTELFLMCDDLAATLDELAAHGVQPLREPQAASWGMVTAIALPSGLELGLYEPRHAPAPDA